MDLRDVVHVACQYLEAIDSPVSLSVYLMIKHGEWEQLAVKRTDPRTYELQDVDKFRRDYLSTELLRKFPGLPIMADPKKVALEKFWESERECAKTNVRLAPYIDDPLSEDCDEGITAFLARVRVNIYNVIGGTPPDIKLKWGPGATYESKELPVSRAEKRNLTLGDKFQQQPHVTRTAECLMPLTERCAHGRARARVSWFNLSPVIVRGNRYFSVKKTATEERGACAEPGENVNFQGGLGTSVRYSLCETGIDLVSGQETHGALALLSSRDGEDATIDLTSASDRVAKNAIRATFPPMWYAALDCARSHMTLVPKVVGDESRWVYLEKFSSMGNGFTFEVETLLFLSICRAIVPKELWSRVKVYGDDIIVPNAWAPAVIAGLRFMGFTPNDRKTFTTSEFRESCGTDAFAGVQIKAFRWDSVPTSPVDWISVHNAMFRSLKGWRDFAMQPIRAAIRSKVPTALWLFGPEWYGDMVVHDHEWRAKAKVHVVNGITWGYGLAQVPGVIELDHFHPEMQYALVLYGVSSTGLGYRESEDLPKAYKRVKLSFS